MELINKIVCGDCLEIMQNIEDESVDLILTDPPYGISSEVKITRGKNTMKFKGTDISHNFGEWDKFKDINEFMNFTYSWVDIAIKKLRPGGMFICYFDKDKINFLSAYLQSKGFKIKDYYADLKLNPVPQARKVSWMSGWEICGLWQKQGGKLIYNYQLGQQKNYGLRPIVGGKERKGHPTQKPLSVMKLFVSYWSNEGDLVCDPFLGSGSTAVACRELDRRYIGIEISEAYCKTAKERLSKAKQDRLF